MEWCGGGGSTIQGIEGKPDNSAGLGTVEAPGQQYYRKYIHVMSISM